MSRANCEAIFMLSCGPVAAAAPDRSSWDNILRQSNASVAFIFIRASSKKSLWWLPVFARAVAVAPIGSGVHLVQKRELTSDDAACVRSVGGSVHIHSMHSSDAEAGPSGGRECTGYLFWLARHWRSLPAHMFFMHEAPPDHLDLAAALASPHGFVNLLSPSAAVLRCFSPPPDEPAAREHGLQLRVRTTYELPASLRRLLEALRLPTPACVLTPCCANFRLRREAAHRRTLADLSLVDRYIRGQEVSAHDGADLQMNANQMSAHDGASSILAAHDGGGFQRGAFVSRGGGSELSSSPSHLADWPTRGMASGRPITTSAWPPTRCHAMEHAWHLLFGEAALLSPLPPRTTRLGRKIWCCAHSKPMMSTHGRPLSSSAPSTLHGPWYLPACPETAGLPTWRATASARATPQPPTRKGASSSAEPTLPRAASLFVIKMVRALLWPDGRCERPAGGAASHGKCVRW